MKRINKKDLKSSIKKIPEKQGIFICYHEQEAIFFKITENLNKFINLYLLLETEDINLLELRDQTSYIDFSESQDLLFCLIEEKLFLDEHQPEFNQRIKVWKDYAYLSLQWNDVPYIKKSQETLGDEAYIGPFRNSFYLQDLIDTFADIYKLPSCEDELFPCEKMNINQCAGYCVFNQDDSLKAILMNFYLFPNIQILNDLRKKIELLEEELNFQNAEVLSEQLKIIEIYYRQLLFLYTSRFINHDIDINGLKIQIKNGIISEINFQNKQLKFLRDDAPRDNELLVLNKDELDERWIIYRYFETHYTDYLKLQFQTHQKDIKSKIVNHIDKIEK